ncbi:two-component system sensor histidine kinase NtrB [Desulfovibrio sp. TomC]|uniref:two-component system sensor histidine kinase NtrB n=1 Tax=Desulfovibrio sp. TomC TaxID=1562888 RepID=UPI0005739139|nr:ATP-binding protein [Desulfovibrio sp. TomC]KHK03820.1 periplasmic sensor signal transduction histidine kinase [Desulfovibrio sp. TomC]
MLTFAHSSYFHDLLDSFTAGVIIVNIRGLVYAANAAATDLLGYDGRQLADPALSAAIIARADAPRQLARFLAAPLKHGRKPEPLAMAYAHPDGETRRFRLSGSLLLENGKIFGILIEITDVTEIYRLHERERAMHLGIQAAQQERIRGLGQFSLAVAHQIRNPLMVIGGFTGRLLRGKAADDPETAPLSMILDGAKRLEAVVRAVSEYARRRELAPAMCDPADIASRAFEAAALRTGLSARLTLDASIGLVRTDAACLTEILTELCANALEAEPGANGQVTATATVSITFARTSDAVAVVVADNGPGPDDAALAYAFDPFYTTKAVGVGMGLPIARRRAEDLGARLSLGRSALGGGAARLVLPQPEQAAAVRMTPASATLP